MKVYKYSIKISDLIAKLEFIESKYGPDVDVIVSDETDQTLGYVQHVQTYKYSEGKVVADIII